MLKIAQIHEKQLESSILYKKQRQESVKSCFSFSLHCLRNNCHASHRTMSKLASFTYPVPSRFDMIGSIRQTAVVCEGDSLYLESHKTIPNAHMVQQMFVYLYMVFMLSVSTLTILSLIKLYINERRTNSQMPLITCITTGTAEK